jgi:hypothetical protein
MKLLQAIKTWWKELHIRQLHPSQTIHISKNTRVYVDGRRVYEKEAEEVIKQMQKDEEIFNGMMFKKMFRK